MESKTSTRKIAIAERRQKALSYRKAGASYRTIAARIRDEMGLPKYGEALAFSDVQNALDEINTRTRLEAEELRTLELERLDMAVLAIASKVKRGDLGAIDRWVKISESRRKLLGLDAPIQLQVAEIIEAELAQFLDQLESVLPSQTFRQVLEAAASLEDRSRSAESN